MLTGEKGDLPSNGSSSAAAPSPSVNQNGYANHSAIIPNGLHYISQAQQSKSPINTSPGFLSRVPEPLNGFKVSDHSYRRINQVNHSPTFDFNGGTNRVSKT